MCSDPPPADPGAQRPPTHGSGAARGPGSPRLLASGSPGDFQAHSPRASAHRSCGNLLGTCRPKGSGPVSPCHQGPSGLPILKDGDHIRLQGGEGGLKAAWAPRGRTELGVPVAPESPRVGATTSLGGRQGTSALGGRLRTAQKPRGRGTCVSPFSHGIAYSVLRGLWDEFREMMGSLPRKL